MNLLIALLALTQPNFSFAANSCAAPLNPARVSYNCVTAGTKAVIQVQEVGVDGNHILADVVLRVSDQSSGKVLEQNVIRGVHRQCRAQDDVSGQKNVREYWFGALGDGSLYAYILSDNDQALQRLWMNSVKVPEKGYVRCTRN